METSTKLSFFLVNSLPIRDKKLSVVNCADCSQYTADNWLFLRDSQRAVTQGFSCFFYAIDGNSAHYKTQVGGVISLLGYARYCEHGTAQVAGDKSDFLCLRVRIVAKESLFASIQGN